MSNIGIFKQDIKLVVHFWMTNGVPTVLVDERVEIGSRSNEFLPFPQHDGTIERH